MTHEAELMFSRIINLAIEKFEETADHTYLDQVVNCAFTEAAEQFEEEMSKIDDLSQDYDIKPKFGVNSKLTAALGAEPTDAP
jgi:hypothetical protein